MNEYGRLRDDPKAMAIKAMSHDVWERNLIRMCRHLAKHHYLFQKGDTSDAHAYEITSTVSGIEEMIDCEPEP